MATKAKSDNWILTLQPLPHGRGEPDAAQRMRRLLKAALRVYGFRCTDIRGTLPPPDVGLDVERDEPPFAPMPTPHSNAGASKRPKRANGPLKAAERDTSDPERFSATGEKLTSE